MARYRFGVWGIDLSDVEFAEALAGAGAQNEQADGRVEFRAPSLPPEIDAASARLLWLSMLWRPLQVAVTSRGDLDPLWLASMLQRANPTGGTYFRRDLPDVPVAWQWPLRIGLFAADAELGRAFDGSELAKLVEFVEVGRDAAECELLLLPCNLRAAVERVMGSKATIGADCTIVMGGPKVAPERVDTLMTVIRDEVRTAGVAVASVPKKSRVGWLRTLIDRLAKSSTIDRALSLASDEWKVAAPLLVCSTHLAEQATLSNYAARLDEVLVTMSMPSGGAAPSMIRVPAVNPRAVEAEASTYDFDAFDVVATREEAESAIEGRIEVPRTTSRGTIPLPPRQSMELPEIALEGTLVVPLDQPLPVAEAERFTTAAFFDATKTVRQLQLAPRTPYFLRIHIGPRGEGTVANVALDESKLPQSITGHELTIAFFELPTNDHEPSSPPARATIFLPPQKTESSTDAWFPILTPASGVFTGRVVVLHQTRVIETLLFTAPLGLMEWEFALREENVIIPRFEVAETRRPFDAALVVNEVAGRTAVMGVTPTSVTYNEPVDISKAIAGITTTINKLTTLPDKVKLADAKVVAALIDLANHGNILWNWIATKLPPELATAERIQIIEARLGAFLPLEFVYPSYAPVKTAKLCPHGVEELAAPRKTKCPNEKARNVVCPSVFWGFSRVLERWPHQDLANNVDYQLSVPKPGGTKLDPLQCAIVGASKRVAATDVASTKKALKPLLKTAPQVVPDWDAWPGAITKYTPSMLILFPHSADDDGFAALEIGTEMLRVSNLESDYVRPEGREPGPLVMLLGCSTKLPPIAFHDFVSRFRLKGAALVVGTLSLIRGRHATRFVKEFVSSLQKKSQAGNAAFGDVLLETKQAMLAAGDPFALTLVAYGDADWRIG